MTATTVTEDDDILYIKMIPGTGVPAQPDIKTEPGTSKEEEAEEAETEETSETEDEKDIDVDEEEEEEQDVPIDRKKMKDALRNLSESSKLRSKAFEKLQQAVPTMKEAELKKLPEKIQAEIENKFSTCVYQFLEDNEDELVRHVMAIGLHYIKQHHQHKDRTYKPLKKKDIASKFNITQRKFTEISQGIAYLGGSK